MAISTPMLVTFCVYIFGADIDWVYRGVETLTTIFSADVALGHS